MYIASFGIYKVEYDLKHVDRHFKENNACIFWFEIPIFVSVNILPRLLVDNRADASAIRSSHSSAYISNSSTDLLLPGKHLI
jgi:hypothetical protein